MDKTIAQNEGNMAMRQKYWSELDDKEKIERMRGIVKNLLESLELQQQKMTKIEKHEHLNGRLVVGLDDNRFGVLPNSYRKQSGDDIYF